MSRFIRNSFFLIGWLISIQLKASACNVRLTSNSTPNDVKHAKRVYVHTTVDLKGKTLELAKNSNLIFKGGSITNGCVVFSNTKISGTPAIYCKVSGSIKNEVLSVDWFLANNDLDHLYDNGVFRLSGMSTIEFRERTYSSGVRGRNNGILFADVTIDGKGATIIAK